MTYMTLAQRVELELGKREPSEIVELNLDNSKASDLEGLTDDFVNLEVLSLASVGLQSLNNLPNLPALRTLELSNNHIAGGLEALLSCPNIEQLNLSNNKIENFESLAPLVKLSCLRSLDLVNCPVATVENYRKKAFAMFGELKYLDGLDENEEEEPVGDEVTNGDVQEAGDDEVDDADDDDDEDASDVDDEDDGEDEVGLEALQRSGDLEDDEEDYAPGEDEEAELDDYDDADEDEDDDVEDDTGVNLSAAGVTGPRRPAAKRRHEEEDEEAENGDEDEVPCAAKHKAGDSVDAHVNNGSTVDK